MTRRVVYKYQLFDKARGGGVGDDRRFRVEMPAGAFILTVRLHQADGTPCFWALVDPEAPALAREFVLLRTGYDELPGDPDAFIYRGTFDVGGGWVVFHVFEARPAPRMSAMVPL